MEDWRSNSLIIFAVTILAALGVVMVYISRFILADHRFGDGYHFLKKQLLFCAVGFPVMFGAARLPARFWLRIARPLFAASAIGLVMVLVTPLGLKIAGARRWLNLGVGTVQPAEVAKLAIVLLLAGHFIRRQPGRGHRDLPSASDLYGPAIATGLAIFLMLLQPDFGTAMTAVALAALILFLAGVRLRYVLGAGLVMLPAFYALILNVDYRRRRFMAFLDPWAHQADSGFQIIQSYVAFQAGGLWGLGLGGGRQKLFYLPEAHTDFILSVIGEELGLLGVLLVILLFGLILWNGMRIAIRAEDPLIGYLAAGMVFLICIPALVNMGVVMGLLPTKGLTLPFVSYGGTSLIINFLACGILLGVTRPWDP